MYQLENVSIKGSKGNIRGKYLKQRREKSPCVLICGPLAKENELVGNFRISSIFKLYGGKGYNVLYFSYRGEGGSEGKFKETFDGVEDSLDSFEWLVSKNYDSRNFSVVGIQYGSVPALEIVTRRPEIHNFLLVNPSCEHINLNHIMNHQSSGQILIDEVHFKNTKDSVQKLKEKLEFNNTETVRVVVVNPSLPALDLGSQLA